MSAINNLKGHLVKDGKVIYSEQIESGLWFNVVLMYEPFYSNDKTCSSSKILCEAVMSTGNKHTWGNGVTSLDDAAIIEYADENGKFKPLRESLKTKDGYRIWQKDVQQSDHQELKSRRVIWLVDVPKIDLIRYCKIE